MLQRFGTALFAIVFATVFGLLVVLSLLTLAAIIVPLLGAGWLALRFRIARTLRASDGRLPVGGAIRIFRVKTLRQLAWCEYGSGIAGFVASLAAPAFVFGPAGLALGLLASGFLGLVGASTLHRRLFETAETVEIIPPGM